MEVFSGREENSQRCNNLQELVLERRRALQVENQFCNHTEVTQGRIPRLEERLQLQNTRNGINDRFKSLDAELELQRTSSYADDDKDCDCFCFGYLMKFFEVLSLALLFISPLLTFYVGFKSRYCEDMFSTWLIFGGVICSVDCLVGLLRIAVKRAGMIDLIPYVDLFITIMFLITIVWWVFGSGRIFSGSILKDPIMEDPSCKWYLYTIPFWYTLCPMIIIIGFMLSIIVCFPCLKYCD